MKKSRHAVAYIFTAFTVVLTALLCFLPKKDFSQNEKRVLASFPEFNMTSLFNGSYFKGIESYVSDHFPLRDAFIGIDSYYALLTGRGGEKGIYKCKDGYLVASPVKPDNIRLTTNLNVIDAFAEQSGLPATLIVIPEAGWTLSDKLPANHGEYVDDDIIERASKCDHVDLIDLRPVFEANRDAVDIYYRTDHHITSAGAYLVYKTFCEINGVEYIKDFADKEVFGDFYGTGYSKSGLWFTRPDELEIWHSNTGNKFEVTVDDMNGAETYNSPYFYEHIERADKYPVFFNGNHALIKIKNLNCSNGKRLLLVKDSYAHCFASFLCENYEEICMVDLRYYKMSTSDLIKSEDLNELLFIYGAENISSLSDIAWLK